MAMNRATFAKQLEPGLNALFGLTYKRFDEQWRKVFEYNTSEKAFEEDVLMDGFGAAPDKSEGQSVSYDDATEQWTARYNHDTVALAFRLTEEAEEDNLYGALSKKYIPALARSMVHSKEIKGANILNRAFNASYAGGDGVELCSTAHPTSQAGNFANELATSADLSETSLEQACIDIANFADDRGIPIATTGQMLIIPPALSFVAERLLTSNLRVGTADNDTNALKSMGKFPDGSHVMQRLTDTDAWFIKTDCPDGLKMFQRIKMQRGMEGDFDTGDVRYKARERYSFGWTDPRAIYGSPGA